MRRFVLVMAGAASAAFAATPAAAQYYGRPYGYGDQGYYGGYGNAGGLEQRIFNVLRGLGGVRPDARERVRQEAIRLDRELRFAARNGLNPYEAHNFDVRIGQLERFKGYATMDRGYGYEGYGYDRRRGGDWGDRGDWRGRDDD